MDVLARRRHPVPLRLRRVLRMDVSRRLACAGLGKGVNAYARLAHGRVKGHASTLVVESLKKPVDGVSGGRRTEQAAHVRRGADPAPPRPASARRGSFGSPTHPWMVQGWESVTHAPLFPLRRGRQKRDTSHWAPPPPRRRLVHVHTMRPCRWPWVPPAAVPVPAHARAGTLYRK